jgi:AGZA family xanthine/uracil permease-like MFS transporter
MVGILMMEGIKKVNLNNLEIAIPAVAMVIMMPFTYSIANGIAFGLILYVIISIILGNWKRVNPVLVILVVLFLLKYILLK